MNDVLVTRIKGSNSLHDFSFYTSTFQHSQREPGIELLTIWFGQSNVKYLMTHQLSARHV